MALRTFAISTVVSSTFVFSPPRSPTKYPATSKPAVYVSHDSLALGLYSVIGAIALSLLSDNVQRNSVSDNNVPYWKGPSPLQQPTATRIPIGCAPAPWPSPPPPGKQPPNRRSSSESRNGKLQRKVQRRQSEPLKRSTRDDPPPPPPPSLAGFIQDFPKPENFEEFIIMNMLFGALCGWILKKIIAYFRTPKAPQKTENLPLLLPKRATISSVPRKSGVRSKSKPSRSPTRERRPTPSPLTFQRSSIPFPFFLTLTLAGSGSLVLFRLKNRLRVVKIENGPNLPTDPGTRFPIHHEDSSPADTESYLDRLLRSPTTPTFSHRRPSVVHRNADDRVRLSKIEQVKYFYKDEIIGFENGPPPRPNVS